MARTRNPVIAERDKEIVDAYCEGDSTSKLALDYGMSEANIWRILNAAGGVKVLGLKRVKKVEQERNVDRDLSVIGSNVSYILHMLQITPVALQLAVNITPARLLKIERGEAADLAVLELRRLADYFGYTLIEFLELRNSKSDDMSTADIVARFNRRHGRIEGENVVDASPTFEKRKRAS